MRSAARSLLPVVLAAISLLTPVAATNYDLVKEYAGSTFFDGWTFYDHFDNLTNGDAVFVSASVAKSAKLAFVDPATNHAIIKVDNTSTVPFNEKRNTVRITTNDRYGLGSVWVADMLHIPYGCSVWPAWWSQSPDWPVGGEIDTLEGVNLVTHNQMGLHTESGCQVVNPVQLASSIQTSTDCSNLTNHNQGCLVTDGNTASYGQGFAAAGGGVWVTELASSGISIWFFPRANIPSALTSNTKAIDTSTLGTPTGNWPSTGCSMDKFFSPHNLIFDITLCGDFAGNPAIFNQTCTGVCYNDYVLGNGSNYATAYFEVASVRVYSSNGTNNIIKGGSSSGSGSPGAANSNGTQTGGNGAVAMQRSMMAMLLALALGAIARLFA
ncbi:putative hydrolase family 16 [Lyophyllum shimeji]|uniref:Hydrolase family 16 n=1 Tax=Lyophyllum shimeji TaxID=47721 RepID=A0A9P3UPC8_LYOSH|nr:putative hydrolase family 16 [Lyophyllum shimeji]